MITAVVGSGGKTTLIQILARRYAAEGKRVLITTTTHMFPQPDTLLTDDADAIIAALESHGCVMAGIPEGGKIGPLSAKTYENVCAHADAVLVEADGSRMLPLKVPGDMEPVIPDNTEQILVVCGLNGIGQPAKTVCHRLERVTDCLGIREDTPITEDHVRKLVTQGYLEPLRRRYPKIPVLLVPRHDGSPRQRAIARRLEAVAQNGTFPENPFDGRN